MTRRTFVLAALACASACERADRAADPIWGKQACAQCGMILSDRRSAAQVMTKTDDRLFFDDAGCMVVWMSRHPGTDRRAWARDADAEGWIPAAEARWRSGARTPMDYGWEATRKEGQPFEAMQAQVMERERRDR